MDRFRSPDALRARMSGALVLLLAAVALLAGGSLLSPDLPGSAARERLPLPPAIGSCVLVAGEAVAAAPCDAPHSGEVVMTWTAGREPAPRDEWTLPRFTVSVARVLAEPASARVCRGWADDYIGWTEYLHRSRGQFWVTPKPLVRAMLVGAPSGDGVMGARWTACIVRTSAERYNGSLRALALEAGNHRPDEVAVCLSAGPRSVAFPDCTEPHTTELIASVWLTQQMMVDHTVLLEHSAADADRLCAEQVRARTGAADPTYGGRLEIVTESVWEPGLRGSELAPPSWIVPDCLVRVVGPGLLNGSVVGVGDGDPPLLNG